MYTIKEVTEFMAVNDVKFIRLAFCDQSGRQKNLSIMPSRMAEAFKKGIEFEPDGIDGFGSSGRLMLMPDINTLQILPWRPQTGRVIRFYCRINNADGKSHAADCRAKLIDLLMQKKAEGKEIEIAFGAKFGLYKTDADGKSTGVPFDEGGYLDMQPLDQCADIRREIALSLDEMGIVTDSTYHADGAGQNEVNMKQCGALTACDNFLTFKSVATAVAARNGLHIVFENGKTGKGCLRLCITVKKGKEASRQEITMDDLTANPYTKTCKILEKIIG